MLDVDVRGLSYQGRETVRLSRAERELRLNCVGLKILTARAGDRELKVRSEPTSEEIVLGPLPAGAREVELTFEGKVSSEGLIGLYRSRHGASGHLLTTHLAPTGARRLFPCVDHPAAKAVFEFEVRADRDQEVVFNTDPAEVREEGGKKRWTFEPTPKMSTYLLYLGVGEFDTVSRKKGRLRVAVRTPPGAKASGAWGLENGLRSLLAYQKYFGIPYPLPKLDLVSVHDFAAGAMENWGAITFRESYLLADRRTSTFLRQVISEVVAHEIAHQWFGNLVTMAWWNDIWLNESFATFMSYKLVDKFYPSWDVWGQFRVAQMGPALQGDALESTHPIDIPVKSVEEIGEVFDEISYGKGASVLRMLEAFVGDEPFRRGVSHYLRDHAYGTSEGKDLWLSVERSSGEAVRRIIGPWIGRPGHPVIQVTSDGKRLGLRQQRYRLEGRHTDELWPIPLAYRGGPKVERHLFEGRETDVRLGSADGPLTLNAGATGFYRVRFDRPGYDRVRAGLGQLLPSERWSLMRDLWSFLFSNDVAPDLFQRFVEELEGETNPAVVQEIALQAIHLHVVLGHEAPLIGALRQFLAAESERLGLSKKAREPASAGIAREAVSSARAFLDPDFAREIASRFLSWSDVDPDLRGAVAVGYARSEGPHAFDPLVARAREAKNEAELEQLLAGMVAFRDPSLVGQTLEWAMGGEVARGLLGPIGSAAARNPDARSVLWPWFWDHLKTFEKVYHGTAMLTLVVERILPSAGLGRFKDVTRALSSRPIPEAERGVRKGLELLAARERLRARIA